MVECPNDLWFRAVPLFHRLDVCGWHSRARTGGLIGGIAPQRLEHTDARYPSPDDTRTNNKIRQREFGLPLALG